MAYEKILTEDRRLVILRLLAEDADYATNDSILQQAVALYSHNVSRDRILADLDWLEEQSLITVEHVLDTRIAKLTQRGLDVAHGRTVVTGVKRPAPKL